MILRLTGTQAELAAHMGAIHRMVEALQASVGGKLYVQDVKHWSGAQFEYVWQIGPTRPPAKPQPRRAPEQLSGRLALPAVGIATDRREGVRVERSERSLPTARVKPFALLPAAGGTTP